MAMPPGGPHDSGRRAITRPPSPTRRENGFFTTTPSADARDQALVARVQAGDREALHDLVQRHQGWIYNIALRMLAHPQDAEDAAPRRSSSRRSRGSPRSRDAAASARDRQCGEIYREHPFHESPDFGQAL